MTVEDSVAKAGSIGKPMMYTRARLVGEDGTDVEAGEVGELWLRGPHVCRGYWNNAEATAAALDADGWFHTGDLAKRDADGFFTIAGRRKDMIISGGVNVYPAEIEGALAAHPDVADSAVVGVPDATWGEIGIAFVVARAGTHVTGGQLAAYLAEVIAKFKIPRAFVFVDALPRTPYGKVVKDELRRRYLTDAAEEGGR
jgi:fatty-acyl-CoA synthase